MDQFRFTSVLILLFLVLKLTVNAQEGRKVFRAGASLSNVTPFLDRGIVGLFGDPPPAEYVHDQLYAKTLVLDDGETRLVFVIVDNIGFRSSVHDAARKLISEQTDIPRENIMIAATHTHSATSASGEGKARRAWEPGFLDEYQSFLVKRIADGVRIAVHELQPARIAWSSFEAPQHVFNRRWYVKDSVMSPLGFKDKVRTNPGYQNPNKDRPAGPVDPEFSFIAVETLQGKPLALLGNYSLHYVGGVPKDHISADYFGVFAERLKTTLGAGDETIAFVGMLSNGTSGDINNLNFATMPVKFPPYKKMKIVADDLVSNVMATYENLQFHDWVPLDAATASLKLNFRKPSQVLLSNLKKIAAHDSDSVPLYHPLERSYLNRITQYHDEFPDNADYIIQAFSIGNLSIGAIPFEVFAETGLEIKAKSPFEDTFVLGIANGYGGYLPTPRQHELGGYETWLTSNKVQKDASELIVDKLLKLFIILKKE